MLHLRPEGGKIGTVVSIVQCRLTLHTSTPTTTNTARNGSPCRIHPLFPCSEKLRRRSTTPVIYSRQVANVIHSVRIDSHQIPARPQKHGDHDRREQESELGPEKLVIQKLLPGHRRGEKELHFGLRKRHGAAGPGSNPHEDREHQKQQRHHKLH